MARHLRHPGGFRHAGRGVGGDGTCARCRPACRTMNDCRCCRRSGCRRRRSRTARAARSRRLLRRSGARCGHGCALRALRARRRPRLRHRQPTSATASAPSAASARASSRSSRSRCAPAPSAPSTPRPTGHADRVRLRRRSPAPSRCRSTPPTRPSPPPRPISSAPPTAPAAGKARSGTRPSTCRAPRSTRWSPNYGAPAFAKIDVEGFEDRVLARPEPAAAGAFLRVHHHPARCRARRCLDRLASLGPYGFDLALGESQVLTFGPLDRRKADMAAHIAALPHEANSGDVYCVLPS